MRLRVSIDGAPAFIDIEGPFTVTPIYQSKHDVPAETPQEYEERVKKPRRYTRERKVCPVCGRRYLAGSRSLYCSDVCRQRAYAKHGGSQKARAWALRIHAGANGVEVEPDER